MPYISYEYYEQLEAEIREYIKLAIPFCVALSDEPTEQDILTTALKLRKWTKKSAKDIGNSPA